LAEEGFREFVEVRYADLLRTAYLLTGVQHTAEDLVQSALLRAMRRWQQIDDPMAYVQRIMVNERISIWHRVGSRELLSGIIGDWRMDRARRVNDASDRVADRDALLLALHRLPVRMRTVLVLRYWEDLSEAQAADLLGCSVGTVKSQASRGLARLRTALDPGPARDSVAAIVKRRSE
jgi:RNA polymerase sigma-70 factor (sigma-E family)